MHPLFDDRVENLQKMEIIKTPKTNSENFYDDEVWIHDKFIEMEQVPKSKEEIISTYGYDIRIDECTKRNSYPRSRGYKKKKNCSSDQELKNSNKDFSLRSAHNLSCENGKQYSNNRQNFVEKSAETSKWDDMYNNNKPSSLKNPVNLCSFSNFFKELLISDEIEESRDKCRSISDYNHKSKNRNIEKSLSSCMSASFGNHSSKSNESSRTSTNVQNSRIKGLNNAIEHLAVKNTKINPLQKHREWLRHKATRHDKPSQSPFTSVSFGNHSSMSDESSKPSTNVQDSSVKGFNNVMECLVKNTKINPLQKHREWLRRKATNSEVVSREFDFDSCQSEIPYLSAKTE